ncbi:hypothetical protein LLG46_01820 [bacterium]|nr:hypothetical protein [bacterium]
MKSMIYERGLLWISLLIAIIVICRGGIDRISAASPSTNTNDSSHSVRIYSTLAEIKQAKDGEIIFRPCSGNEPVVTFIRIEKNLKTKASWFSIEARDASAGLWVETNHGMFLPDPLAEGDKIVYMKGRLESVWYAGRVFRLAAVPKYSPGNPQDIPEAISVSVRECGGAKDGNTPGTVNAVGRNTDSMLIKVKGISSGYGKNGESEWFFLDDGSGVPNDNGYKGVRIMRGTDVFDPSVHFPTRDGTRVEVEGLSTSKDIQGVGRIRGLRIRYDGKGIVSDRVRMIGR